MARKAAEKKSRPTFISLADQFCAKPSLHEPEPEATPELPAAPALSLASGTYRLTDPDLEALSAGRKALLRMGPDNARRVKAVLARFRDELSADARVRADAGVEQRE